MSQIRANNVEYKLEQGGYGGEQQGYGKPEPGYQPPKPPAPEPDPKPPAPEPEHGLIPKEYRPLAWMMMIGFLVCFLADFAGRAAYDTYKMYVTGSWSAPPCWDFKLLFHCNLTM